MAWVAYGVVMPFVESSAIMSRVSVAEASSQTWATVLTLVKRALIVFASIATADYLIKRYQLRKGLKMTKQEVKEEQKMLEGNPEIKGRVRRLQREMARRRMLAAVPKATVVITNPTHYAVALEYKRDAMAGAARRRQGRRPPGAAHQGRCARARRADRRERAAGPGALRQRRDRRA